MPTTPPFYDLLRCLNAEKAEYLVVGAHAVIYYAEPRYTKDHDVWVNPSAENAARVHRALRRFGAPLAGIAEHDFADPELVFQMGVPPNRIDILMGVDGLDFTAAWPNRVSARYLDEPMWLIGRDDLIRNKLASGRPQDLLDVARLRESS